MCRESRFSALMSSDVPAEAKISVTLRHLRHYYDLSQSLSTLSGLSQREVMSSDSDHLVRFPDLESVESYLACPDDAGVSMALLHYYGAKWALSRWIIRHFPPRVYYDVFVDGFGGSGAITFAAPSAPVEIWNDVDKIIWTFMTMLRTRRDDLLEAIMLTPYSRYELWQCERLRRIDLDSLDPLEIARQFYVLSWQGRGGRSASYPGRSGWRFARNPFNGNYPPNDFYDVRDVFRCAERLQNVQLECSDIFEILDRYDSPKTLFYLDPPYSYETVRYERRGYVEEWPEHRQRELLERIRTLEGFVLLSGFTSSLYRDVIGDWQSVTKTMITGEGKTRQECLWLSPNISNIQLRMF
jgi:DNA adenine methylase